MSTTFAFDGSGIGPNCDVLVLAGIGAPDRAWDAIRIPWQCEVEKLGMEAWHSTDYLGSSKNVGRRPVPAGLLELIAQLSTGQFQAVTCALSKSDSAHVRTLHPMVPTDAVILVSLCFNGLGVTKEDDGKPGQLLVLFDRGEPFINPLKKFYERGRRETRKEPGWPTQIAAIEPAASRDRIELQVADLLAWSIRRWYEHRDDRRALQVILLLLPRLLGCYLDKQAITEIYVNGERPMMKHTLHADDLRRHLHGAVDASG